MPHSAQGLWWLVSLPEPSPVFVLLSLYLAAVVVQHCDCFFICCGLGLWLFLSVLIICCYVTTTPKLSGLNQPQVITSSNSVGCLGSSAGLTWVHLCGCSKLESPSWPLRELACLGLSTWVSSSLSPLRGALCVPRGWGASRPLMAEPRKSQSNPCSVFFWSKQVRRPVQFQGLVKSQYVWSPVSEGITVPFFGQTVRHMEVHLWIYVSWPCFCLAS